MGPHPVSRMPSAGRRLPAPLATKVAAVAEQVAAFARIGTKGPTPEGSRIAIGGLGNFVLDQGGTVLHARLDADGRLIIQPAGKGKYPEPSGFKFVVVGSGRDQVTYTAARHWLDGTNEIGQNSADFPFCLVNLPAWRRTPWDLGAAGWYRSEEEALAKYAPQPPEPDWAACVATFPRGVQVELRRENSSRWLM